MVFLWMVILQSICGFPCSSVPSCSSVKSDLLKLCLFYRQLVLPMLNDWHTKYRSTIAASVIIGTAVYTRCRSIWQKIHWDQTWQINMQRGKQAQWQGNTHELRCLSLVCHRGRKFMKFLPETKTKYKDEISFKNNTNAIVTFWISLCNWGRIELEGKTEIRHRKF